MIKATKKSEVKRDWLLLDAKGQVLGRLATQVVPLLIGKNKPYFVRNLDVGNHVVVINAKDIVVTGRKEAQKAYYSFSGYPGGLKKTSFSQMKAKAPERIIQKAVYNMLPKNKLRADWIKRLHVFAESQHDYEDKFGRAEKVKRKL